MRVNMSDLLDKAEEGEISNDEIKEVIYRIENLTDKPNLEILLTILGATGRFEYKKILENFLVYPEDPMISKAVLSILCQEWGMADQYLPYIKKMMRGVDWDEYRDVRLVALTIAGDFLCVIKEKELLKILIDVFKNEEEEEMITRGCAYEGILKCIGVSSRDLPSVGSITHHLEDVVDHAAIEKAYKILNEK